MARRVGAPKRPKVAWTPAGPGVGPPGLTPPAQPVSYTHLDVYKRQVLDWELATVGDPLMDLGSALAYWVQADDDLVMQRMRRQPTHAPGTVSYTHLDVYKRQV